MKDITKVIIGLVIIVVILALGIWLVVRHDGGCGSGNGTRVPDRSTTTIVREDSGNIEKIQTRTQFSFYTTQKRLGHILEQFASATPPINVVAISLSGSSSGEGRVTTYIVPGPADNESQQDSDRVANILQSTNIEFNRANVLRVLHPEPAAGTSGAYRRFFEALSQAHITILSSYIGEGVTGSLSPSLIFDVPEDSLVQSKLVLEMA